MSGTMWEVGEYGAVIDHVVAGIVEEAVVTKRGGAVLLKHPKGLCLLVDQERWSDTVGIISWVTNQIRGVDENRGPST